MAEEPPSKKTRIEEGAKQAGGVILKIGESFSQNASKFKLLEATPEIRSTLSRGDKIYFKGDDKNEAVLCSSTLTYRIKKVETSNLVLLIPPKSSSGEEQGISSQKATRFEAIGSSTFTYITEILPPQLEKLYAMIAEYPYGTFKEDSTNELIRARYQELHHSHDEGEKEEVRGKRPSFADLLHHVQASEKEIVTALSTCNAIEIDGRWCSVGEDLIAETMDALLDAVTLHDINIKAISLDSLLTHMTAYDNRVIEHCLKIYSSNTPKDTSSSSSGSAVIPDVYELDLGRIAVFRVHQIFRNLRKLEIHASELFEKWEQSLPFVEGQIFDACFFEPLLRGVAIKTKQRDDSGGVGDQEKGAGLIESDDIAFVYYQYFSHEELPLDPALRFARIFEVKPEWTKEELVPYLSPILTAGLTIDNLLLKHTRKITPTSGDTTPRFCVR